MTFLRLLDKSHGELRRRRKLQAINIARHQPCPILLRGKFVFRTAKLSLELVGMFQINLRSYLNLAREMEQQATTFGMIEAENEADAEYGRPQSQKLDEQELEVLKARIERMERFAGELDLTTSQALLSLRLRDGLPKTGGEWQMLMDAINVELKNRLFLFVPAYRAGFYEQLAPDWAVAPRFPSAAADYSSAGNCFAVGENTACVFHLMRVCEVGLRVFAVSAGAQMNSDSATWGELLSNIQTEIKKMRYAYLGYSLLMCSMYLGRLRHEAKAGTFAR